MTARSASSAIVAHAARGADGTLGVLVVNTQAPAPPDAEPLPPLAVPLALANGELPASGVRYDYAPAGNQPGALDGPVPFDDLGSPPVVSVAPYQATLLVFAPDASAE